jgi:hypothetical protein
MDCDLCMRRQACHPYVQRIQKSCLRRNEKICSIGTSNQNFTEKFQLIRDYICSHKASSASHHADISAEQRQKNNHQDIQRAIFVSTPLRKYNKIDLLKSCYLHFIR